MQKQNKSIFFVFEMFSSIDMKNNMIHVSTNFGSKIPTNKKDSRQKSKMPAMSSIVHALKQDKAQCAFVRGLRFLLFYCTKLYNKIEAFWTYCGLKF